jgi:hypothetical protein
VSSPILSPYFLSLWPLSKESAVNSATLPLRYALQWMRPSPHPTAMQCLSGSTFQSFTNILARNWPFIPKDHGLAIFDTGAETDSSSLPMVNIAPSDEVALEVGLTLHFPFPVSWSNVDKRLGRTYGYWRFHISLLGSIRRARESKLYP